MPAISVIMPCYNRAHDLIRTLQAYDRQNSSESFELIAVDDASTDRTYEVLTSYRPSRYTLRVERMEVNQGQGAARNRVIPSITSPLALFVGDDMIPTQDFIKGHLTAHRHYPSPDIAILGRVEWSAGSRHDHGSIGPWIWRQYALPNGNRMRTCARNRQHRHRR